MNYTIITEPTEALLEITPPTLVTTPYDIYTYLGNLLMKMPATNLHPIHSDRSYQFVGWDSQVAELQKNPSQWGVYDFYMTEEVRDFIKKSAEDNIYTTTGVKYTFPNPTVERVMTSAYNDYRPEVGDIYSRYTINCDAKVNDLNVLVQRAVEWITNKVRNEVLMRRNNESMSVWSTLYGSFNPHGLRAHSIIKLREREPARMQFNMKY